MTKGQQSGLWMDASKTLLDYGALMTGLLLLLISCPAMTITIGMQADDALQFKAKPPQITMVKVLMACWCGFPRQDR